MKQPSQSSAFARGQPFLPVDPWGMVRGDYFRLQIDAIRPLRERIANQLTRIINAHRQTSAWLRGRLNVMSRSKYKTTLTDAHDGQEG